MLTDRYIEISEKATETHKKIKEWNKIIAKSKRRDEIEMYERLIKEEKQKWWEETKHHFVIDNTTAEKTL